MTLCLTESLREVPHHDREPIHVTTQTAMTGPEEGLRVTATNLAAGALLCLLIVLALLPATPNPLRGLLVVLALFMGAAIGLNVAGQTRSGRGLFLLTSFFCVFGLSTVLGPESGVMLWYPVVMLAAYTAFDEQHRSLSHWLVGLALTLATADILLEVHLPDTWLEGVSPPDSLRWLLVPGAVLTGALLIHALMKQVEQSRRALVRSHEKLEAIITTMNDVVFEVDEKLNVLNIWTADERALPYPRSLYESIPPRELLPAALYSLFEHHARQARETGRSVTFEYLSPTNGRFYEASIIPLRSADGGLRYSVALRDRTRERQRSQRMHINDEIIRKSWTAVLFVDPEGIIRYANDAAHQLYHMNQHDTLTGRNLSECMGENAAGRLLAALRSRSSHEGELEQARPDGSTFSAWIAGSAITDEHEGLLGYSLFVRDNSQEKEARTQLLISEQRFRSMTEHAPGVVFEAQAFRSLDDWMFTFMSPQLESSLGLSVQAVLDDKNVLLERIPEPDRQPVLNALRDAARGLRGWRQEFRLRVGPGDERWIRGISTPIRWDHSSVVFHGILMDITGEKRYREMLLEKKAQAEAISRIKSDFLSTMSHEIRTPLNAIIGLAHLLLEESPREDQVDNLRTLAFSAQSLLSLINDILDYSKIEAGKIELEQTVFSLQTLVDSLMKAHTPHAREKGIHLRSKLDERLPAHFRGDPTRLSQILNNLLSNAIKFTHDGWVELRIETAPPLPGAGTNLTTLCLSVTDTGSGIPADKLDHIFERFTQADESITRAYGGTGLGLAITKGLVDVFGGRIEVDSEPGIGSTFRVLLPLEPVSAEAVSDALPPATRTDLLRGKSVLLVDDNRVNVMVGTKLLKRWGARVTTALNGLEAIEVCRHQHFDLILMDLQMPLMDGFEASRILQEEGLLNGARIIALTAATTDEVRQEAAESGIHIILAKPINPDQLAVSLQQFAAGETGHDGSPDGNPSAHTDTSV